MPFVPIRDTLTAAEAHSPMATAAGSLDYVKYDRSLTSENFF